jgi:hypothetical protein
MRSELGKISLDSVFSERDTLNQNIVASIQAAATVWGLEVLRYEIRDIMPPSAVRNAMELQAEAERRKRAQVGLRGRLTGAGVPGCATSWRCFLGGGVGGGIRNVMELPLCGVAG